MSVLNLIVIHTEELTTRQRYINSTIDMIQKIVKENTKMIFKLNVIKTPDLGYIEKNIEIYNKRVNYDKENDEEFNNQISNLNVAQISNIEKHREAYKLVNNPNEYYMIIEDDSLIGEDYLNNIKQIFIKLDNNKLIDWDILFTCIATINNNTEMGLVDSREQYKFLLSKSSYFITPSMAKKLYNYLEIFKYSLKLGISNYIWTNKKIKSVILNRHSFLEGSKIGLFPSSINNSNFLFQNSNFVKLARLTNNIEITEDIIAEAENIYKDLKKLNSADVLHTMGVLYYKKNDYEHAKIYMLDAYNELIKNKGYISKGNELLNNVINIHQYEQIYLEECKNKKSKYSV